MTKSEIFNETYGLTGLNRSWFMAPTAQEREVKVQRIVSGKPQNV